MEIFKAAGFALAAAAFIVLLRQYLPAYSVLALAGAAMLFLGAFASAAAPAVAWLEGLGEIAGQEEFSCLLKAAGIALVAQNVVELCKDAGLGVLAYGVELTGRCLVLAAALPLLRRVLERLMLLMQ